MTNRLSGTRHSATELSPWVGFAVFCLWALATLAIGAVTLVRRDA